MMIVKSGTVLATRDGFAADSNLFYFRPFFENLIVPAHKKLEVVRRGSLTTRLYIGSSEVRHRLQGRMSSSFGRIKCS